MLTVGGKKSHQYSLDLSYRIREISISCLIISGEIVNVTTQECSLSTLTRKCALFFLGKFH